MLLAAGACSESSGGADAPGGAGPGTGGASSGGASTSSGGSASGGSGEAGAAHGSGGAAPGSGGSTGSFALSSSSWDAVDNDDCTDEAPAACPLYPREHTYFGANVSPDFSWTPGPAGTQSYALVLVDLSLNSAHWALWDIPATTTSLPAELPAGTLADGSRQSGFNPGDNASYFGSGACGNVYEHRLVALDVAHLTPSAPLTATTVIAAIDSLRASGGVLAESFVRLQSREYCSTP